MKQDFRSPFPVKTGRFAGYAALASGIAVNGIRLAFE
jgi:hypothetical protein